jgi:protein TonB
MKIRLRIAWGERSERILMKMAGFSAVGHLIALIVFSMLPRFTTPPPMPRTTIAEIIPASALLPAGAPAGLPAPAARQAEPTPSQRAEAARKAAEEPEPAPRDPVKVPKKRPDATVPPPPDEKAKRKPAPEPEPPTPPAGGNSTEQPPSPPAAASMAGISLGGTARPGGIPSIGSSAFPYDYYRSSLVAIIQSNWRRPVTPEGLREPVSCRVQFTILKSGIVQDARVSAPSGNGALDQSALRALYDSNPLPPLPFQYGQASVSAEVVFELTPD